MSALIRFPVDRIRKSDLEIAWPGHLSDKEVREWWGSNDLQIVEDEVYWQDRLNEILEELG